MSELAIKKERSGNVAVVKKMKDYRNEPAFRKKAEKATTFLKKNGLPKSFAKKTK